MFGNCLFILHLKKGLNFFIHLFLISCESIFTLLSLFYEYFLWEHSKSVFMCSKSWVLCLNISLHHFHFEINILAEYILSSNIMFLQCKNVTSLSPCFQCPGHVTPIFIVLFMVICSFSLGYSLYNFHFVSDVFIIYDNVFRCGFLKIVDSVWHYFICWTIKEDVIGCINIMPNIITCVNDFSLFA